MICLNTLKNICIWFILLSTFSGPLVCFAQGSKDVVSTGQSGVLVNSGSANTSNNGLKQDISHTIATQINDLLPIPQGQFLGSEYWRWFLCALSLLILLIMRTLIVRYLFKWLHRLTGMTDTDLDDKLIEVLTKPFRGLIWVIGIYTTVGWLNVSESVNMMILTCYRIALIILVTWGLGQSVKVIAEILAKFASKTPSKLDDYVVPFVARLIKMGTYSVGALLVIQEFGVNVAGIIAGLGVGGLAFALAAQDTLANWFGAVMIYTDRPFEVGDRIKTSQLEGVVEEVGLRSTQIRTFSQTVVSIPNRQIANEVIENFTKMDKRRISMKVGVTYDTTPAMLEESVERIRDILRNHKGVDQSFWLVKFTEFGDSALEIFIYYFTLTIHWEEYLSIKQDINLQIMQRLNTIGVEFAFPSMSIYQASNDPDHISKLDAQARRLFASRTIQVNDIREDMVAPSEGNADG